MPTARIKTFSHGNKHIFLDGESAADKFRIASLVIQSAPAVTESFDLAGNEMVIAKNLLTLDSAPGDPVEVYRFTVPEGTNLVLTANIVFATGQKKFLGRDFSIDAGYSARLTLRLLMNSVKNIRPSITIGLCGQFELDLGGGTVQVSSAPICIQVDVEELFDALPAINLPSLSIGLPDFGIKLPKFTLPWDFPNLPSFPFRLPGHNSPSSGFPLKVSWKSARISHDKEKISADLIGLRIESSRHALEGDLHLVYEDGAVKVSESYFDLYRPDQSNKLRLQFDQWHVDDGCLLIGWKKGQLNNWLKLLLPDMANVVDTDTDIIFRILWDEGELTEVRLDWIPAESRTIKLPGIKVDLPPKTLFSLVYYKQADDHKFALIVTEEKDQQVIVRTSFALNRGTDERELLNDREQETDPELVKLTATAQKNISVALVDFSPGGKALKLFKQLNNPLQRLGVVEFTPGPGPVDPPEDPNEEPPQNLPAWPDACQPSDISFTSISADAWKFEFDLPIMKLPFLKQGGSQFIQVKLVEKRIELPKIACVIQVTVAIGGSLKLAGTANMSFNIETMAFEISDGGGIDFIIPQTEEVSKFLGLTWKFIPGAENKLFTLVTKDKDYQLKQAPGAVVQATYPEVGTEEEPLKFELRDFVLGSKGISVKGRVTPAPIKLGGLNTRFRFTEGEFTIVENKIRDFSIAGSGALPPKLVGEATADIALQFRMNKRGNLELAAGLARLRGKNLLDCKSTRFQFTIDGLGLKFVNDGRYHFYFTLTGMAKFVPLPGDDSSGPLSWLPGIEMQLMECPLTDDVSVLSKHIKFLVEMPRKPSFEFLGCFKMELRGIGFIPRAPMFNGDAAMELAGQVMFADGTGDVIEAAFDFHNLFIGLPEPGKFFPRIHFKGLTVKLRQGDAFAVEGSVDFFDNDLIEPGLIARGFGGRGSLSIQGLPTFTAAFTFIRVSRDQGEHFVRAWFIFVQVEKISLRIPLLNVFIREIGLGFGYRYTLASIRAADDLDDPRALIKELRRLSLTQGELSKRDQWRVVIEDPGQSPRWTVAARMMISQNSASQQATDWHPKVEKTLSCLFLLDVVLGLRSDLTFLMTARAWLNTNYNDYRVTESLRSRPLLSGFVLLSPRKKRLLAHFASNPGAEFGDHPPLPEFIKRAIRNSQFSATLLIEPGLIHYELGWPTQLSWRDSLGPLTAEFRGGTIFRISRTDIVYGNSFMARGTLELAGQAGGDSVGARVSATARVAYGARYIGVIGLVQPIQRSALYGAVGIEINVRFRVEFWLRFKVGFVKITIRLHFQFTVQITALVELGFTPQTALGVSGRATLSLRIMGRGLHFKIHVGLNHGAVNRARAITSQYINIGLEAAEAEPIPGTKQSQKIDGASRSLSADALIANALGATLAANAERSIVADREIPTPGIFVTPGYFIFCIPVSQTDCYFLLYPNEKQDDDQKQGFLPVPPAKDINRIADFEWEFPTSEKNFVLQQFNPETDAWPATGTGIDLSMPYRWKAHWDEEIGSYEDQDKTIKPVTLTSLLRKAYITQATSETEFEDILPVDDPKVPAQQKDVFEDARVYNPSDAAFEAAVRGAAEQFEGSPYFRQDKNSFYAASLLNAFSNSTSIYADDGQMPEENEESPEEKEKRDAAEMAEQALHLRSAIVNQMLTDFQQYVEDRSKVEVKKSVAFQMGLVFRTTGGIPLWLKEPTMEQSTIKQRSKTDSTEPDSATPEKVVLFNTAASSFQQTVPQFQRVRDYTDANTIAITWDLVWSDEVKAPMRETLKKFIDEKNEADFLDQQTEPEQFLKHYLIRRRSLDGKEAETEFTVKPVEILNKPSIKDTMTISFKDRRITCANGGLHIFRPEQQLGVSFNGKTIPVKTVAGAANVKQEEIVLEKITPADFGLPETDEVVGTVTVFAPELIRLRSRFQFTDNFNDESLEDQIALGREGKSYIYTIIPVDVTGRHSPRPLTLVATRRANYPPNVPSESELQVLYKIDEKVFETTAEASVLKPHGILLSWKKPADIPNQPKVSIKNYRLVFRKEKALPIGSYGLDTETEGNRNDGLPSSNARVLRTDIIVSIEREKIVPIFNTDKETGPRWGIELLSNDISLDEIFPKDLKWRPEAWRIFLQTEGTNGVLSPIVPLEIVIRFEPITQPAFGENLHIKRMPELLEWITRPVALKMVAPEDAKADVDLAAFPMPVPDIENPLNSSINDLVTFLKHPEDIRVVELQWNQSPGVKTSFPTNLQSGYQLYEFDVDAHTADSIDNPDDETFLSKLRRIREVELLSPAALNLSPDNTTIADQWEAWYPGMVRRMQVNNPLPKDTRPEFSKAKLTPWFSWRESYLEWVNDAAIIADTMTVTFKGQVITAKKPLFNKTLFKPGSFVRITGFAEPNNNGLKQLHNEQNADPKSMQFIENSFRPESNVKEVTLLLTIEAVPATIADDNLVINAEVIIDAGAKFPTITFTGTPPDLNPGEFIRITDTAHAENNGYRQVSIDQQDKTTITFKGRPFIRSGKTNVTLERSTATKLHPFLFWLAKELENDNDIVELNPAPPFRIDNLELLQQQTLPAQDPYGWNILKTLGLSIAFSIRDRNTGKTLAPDEIKKRLIEKITELQELGDTGLLTDEVNKHLFIEYLFKPSRSTKLQKDEAAANDNDLLSLIQVSLRPVARQHYKYRCYHITKKRNEKGEIESAVKDVKKLTLTIEWKEPAKPRGSLIEITRDNAHIAILGPKMSVEATFPADNEIRLLLHSTVLPTTILANPNADLFIIKEIPVQLTDWQSLHFDAPVEDWKTLFKGPTEMANQWQRLGSYLMRINPPGESSVVMPSPENTQDVLNMMKWTDRFFTASANVAGKNDELHTRFGVNIASAYPRVMSPTALAPDAAGRLTYYHRIEDGWAHVYRYYFLPQHRYDKLLQALAGSSELFPKEKPQLTWFQAPAPQSGGLDVVIDRIKEVSAPVVLFSGRLDESVGEAEPVNPGKTWEVIIAKHPEQLLIERNRTLVRQLEYRQTAHALLRKFGFEEDLNKLNQELIHNNQPAVKPVYPEENTNVQLPGDMEQPNHLPVEDMSTLDPAVRASLDLPSRLGAFSNDALVLQFEQLPYFYKHLLLIVAQTSHKVSPVTAVVQQDLEYRSPKPAVELKVDDVDGRRFLHLNIRLNSYRDCLPEGIGETWSEPASKEQLYYADLPDTGVVYQVTLKNVGNNVEAQTEFRYNPDKQLTAQSGTFFEARPLGKQFAGIAKRITQPKKHEFYLETEMQPVNVLSLPRPREREDGTVIPASEPVTFSQGELARKLYYQQLPVIFPRLKQLLPAGASAKETEYILSKHNAATVVTTAPVYPADFPETLKRKISVLRVTGGFRLTALAPLNEEERELILKLYPASPNNQRVSQFNNDLQNRDAYTEFFRNWFSEEPVTGKNEFAIESDRIEYPAPASCVLTLNIEKKDRIATLTALQELPQEELDHSFAAALRSLADQLANMEDDEAVAEISVTSNACIGIEQLEEIAAPGGFSLDADNRKFTWHGLMNEQQQAVIKQWRDNSDFGDSFQRLLDDITEFLTDEQYALPLPSPAPPVPQILAGRFDVGEPTDDPAMFLLSWKGLNMNFEEERALNAFIDAATGSLKEATQRLLSKLSSSATTIEIAEAAWLPRLHQGQLPDLLKDHLLIGRGMIRWWGWMTAAEGETLSASSFAVNKRAVKRLFAATMKHGFNESSFMISARRGSAANQSYEIPFPKL